MKEHPILMQTENVKAILDGKKTQTRRVIKPQPFTDKIFRNVNTKFRNKTQPCVGWNKGKDGMVFGDWAGFAKNAIKYCPYGQVGDRLWVRETSDYIFGDEGDYLIYKADDESLAWFNERKNDGSKITWKPSIFMPRWASRITLEITGVRVERLQEITPAQIESEGFAYIAGKHSFMDAINWFKELWDSLNAKRGYGWDTNPWVWVIKFKRIDSDKTHS